MLYAQICVNWKTNDKFKQTIYYHSKQRGIDRPTGTREYDRISWRRSMTQTFFVVWNTKGKHTHGHFYRKALSYNYIEKRNIGFWTHFSITEMPESVHCHEICIFVVCHENTSWNVTKYYILHLAVFLLCCIMFDSCLRYCIIFDWVWLCLYNIFTMIDNICNIFYWFYYVYQYFVYVFSMFNISFIMFNIERIIQLSI